MPGSKLFHLQVVLLAITWAVSAGAQTLDHNLRTVVLSGDRAPGGSSDLTFARILEGTMNRDGRVTFVADVAGAGGIGIWSEAFGTIQPLIRQGAIVAGDPDGAISWLIDPEDSDDDRYDFQDSEGTVIVQASTAAGVDSSRIWRFDNPNFSELVVNAGAPSGEEHLDFYQFHLFGHNTAGTLLFQATLRKPGLVDAEKHSLWTSSRDGQLTKLLQTGDTVPGIPSGWVVDDIGWQASINQAGSVALIAEVSEDPVPGSTSASSYFSVWRATPARELQLVALADSTDPNTKIPRGYINAIDMDINGNIAFSQSATLWKSTAGGLAVLVTGSDELPLGAMHGSLSGIDHVDVADDESVAFQAVYRPNESGEYPDAFSAIWQQRGEELVPLIYPTQQLDNGATVLGIGHAFERNASGQISIFATLEEVHGDIVERYRAIVAQDAQGEWQTIVREGQLLTVEPGDVRTIDYLSIGNAEDESGWLNDRGQILFRATFTGGETGLFVSNTVAIPEPKSWGLLSVAGVIGLGWRRYGRR